ncbi:SRPBCC family protein [Parabacteroides sp. Marseille-P3160]|uniref:SRPBCC family protein n=1 Tax=Parabacteroides sp. Marseille-P3160 TaxID=1917887 RepID=UPI0009B950B6|nr:SRPBCC family protein [Parabacteroides sp. Marseille-P3160]
MTEFVSEVKTISHNDGVIFSLLSDLSNLEKIKDKIPQDKISDFSFDTDSCTLEVAPAGKITFRIVEREPNKTIKFATTDSPVPLFLWIQLKPVGENDTKLRLTVHAELNPFIKPMVSKPLQDALDKMSALIASLPYE